MAVWEPLIKRCKEYVGEIGIASGTEKPSHTKSAVTWDLQSMRRAASPCASHYK